MNAMWMKKSVPFCILCLSLIVTTFSRFSESAPAEASRFDQYGNPSVFSDYLPRTGGETNYLKDTKTYRAKSYDERIKFIILHYTATDNETGKRALTIGNVSSHYLITSVADEPVLSLVDDDKRAWHAGDSMFYGRSGLNDTSIGIEIINRGISAGKYLPYSEAQIRKTALLLKHLIQKYHIEAKFVLGHSDIAPGRKLDPGPLFPWEHLYREYGIGAWYNEKDKKEFLDEIPEEKFAELKTLDFQKELYIYGYRIFLTDKLDAHTRNVIRAFQSHFHPEGMTGVMDRETYAILLALNKKYPGRKVPGSTTE